MSERSRPVVHIEADDAPRDDAIERETDIVVVGNERSDGEARVRAAFAAAREDGRAALVVYLPANFPDLGTSLACFEAAVAAGADLVEMGLPFSDPVMDGPIIQAANQQVLAAGATVADHLALAATLTSRVDAPVLAMTYVTLVDARGYELFAEQAVAAGLAGVILPDLPINEADDWRAVARDHDLASVMLTSTASSPERLAATAAASTGFVYATGLLGVTGVKPVAIDDTRALVARIRETTDTPVAVGIGVRTRQDAAAVSRFADGVIVGSAAVAAIAEGEPATAPERVRALVADLRAGTAGT